MFGLHIEIGPRRDSLPGEVFFGRIASQMARTEVDLERLREVAFLTIGRAVGFGGLAVFCVMAGTAFDPLLAVQAGGFGVLIILAVLLIKARFALTADHRKTEMWLYLKKEERPAEAYARWAASTVLRDTYLQFARWMAVLAVAFWTLAVLLRLFGYTYVDPYSV